MADPRLTNHQQFDLIRCKMCNRLYEDPRLLTCLHSFCHKCLESHVAETVRPYAEEVGCPLCNQVTPLPDGNMSELTRNSLLTKYIQQAQRDATVAVAGREVLEIQRQALTETEQQCPEITASMQKIADTASHVIANGTSQQSEVHGYDTVKARQELQSKIVNIQERSLQIVYAIDKVNQDLESWLTEKNLIRERIKQRSQLMQELIRNNEIHLLTKLDANDLDSQMKDECFHVKTKLHKILKGGMTLVDFVKVLSEFGNKEELEQYTGMIEEQDRKLTNTDLRVMHNIFSFDCPSADIQDGLQTMFGTLSDITEETTVWDPHRKNIEPVPITMEPQTEQTKSEGSPENDLHLTASSLLSPPSGEESDNDLTSTTITFEDSGPRYTKRFDIRSPQKTRRRPLKSMSFDAGTSYSTYMAKKMASHVRVMQTSQSETKTVSHDEESHLLHEKDETIQQMQADFETTTESSESSNSSGDSGQDNSARQKLLERSRLSQFSGQRDWLRRLSAPTTTINDLARRRLSALSILEKANISTDGMALTQHVESGLNEARLEWLRENVRTRTRSRLSERSISMDSGQI